MKVRLEIIDDDGIESANVNFTGRLWKKRLLAFLDTVVDETDTNTEPSSYSSNSEVPVAEQHAYQPQFVQQQVPNLQQSSQQAASVQLSQGPAQQQQVQQQPVQKAVPQQFVQQQQFQQPMQQVTVPLQYQQQLQQSQIPAMQQNFQQAYPQYPVNQNNQQPVYLQPTLAPVGMQQYGQPVQPLSSTVHQPYNSNQQVPPAVSNLNQPVQAEGRSAPTRRRTPMLQDRLNDMSLTISERLELFLRYEYPRVWFSSQDVQQHYEKIYGTIKQSTVSTYLSRMFRKTLLERRGNRTQREYRYIADEPESTYKMEEVPGAPVYHGIQY
ncbi:hypothetical protein [Methanolobus sp. ZRKC5]|uniref:hypothetical protein n=1 Tax=Methanolobus sp. ZRKC5 TaxID=3136295 RepID=UPI00313DA039